MGRAVFIDVEALERRPLAFDEVVVPGLLSFPDNWTQTGEVAASGLAELLDKQGSKTIRVRGSLRAAMENECARCLEVLKEEFDGEFELYFYPMAMIAKGEEKPISREETEIGFYEENGIPLVEVIREQLVLWLPIRGFCREDCKGICPHCGTNRNREGCECREEFVDPRWESLRHMDFKN